MKNDDDFDNNDDEKIALVDVPMLANSTIGEVEQAAMTLRGDEEAQLQSWLVLSAVLRARAREIRHKVEQIAIKWIEANGPLTAGDMKYSVGYSSAVHCVDKQRTVDLILEACEGDLSAIVDHLRADPFKYGSVRSTLGEANYKQVFQTIARPKLVAGAPQVELLATNTRYLPARRSAASKNQSIVKSTEALVDDSVTA